jgi:hypothetical protein
VAPNSLHPFTFGDLLVFEKINGSIIMSPINHGLRFPLLVLVCLLDGATLFSGGSGTFSTPPTLVHLFEAVGKTDTSQFARQVIGVGDQNGDGREDFLVSAFGEHKSYLYFGGNPPSTTPAMVFSDVTYTDAAADVNGDGKKDLLFACLNFDNGKGYTKLHFGGALLDTIPDLKFFSPDSGDDFGTPYSLGDFNGDGFEDFAVTAIAYPKMADYPFGKCQGKVSVFYGGQRIDTISHWTIYGDSLWHFFGASGVAAGDLNGDGYSDMIIGEQTYYQPFRQFVKIFWGAPKPDTLPGVIIYGSAGPTVVGDINGDGFEDYLLTKDNGKDTMALLYFGGAVLDTLPKVALKRSSFSGTSPAWKFSPAGDINGDGFGDIIVGNRWGFGGFGEVLIYLGGSHMSGNFAFGFTGYTNAYEGAGEAVGRAGDCNGDGTDDILFGAWNDNPGSGNFPGRAELFGGDTTITGITSNGASPLPESFKLLQNYPNPFNGQTTIAFTIPPAAKHGLIVPVDLVVYDLEGREIKKLLSRKEYVSGDYMVVWDGTSDLGKSVASGIYLYRLSINGHALAKKMILIR